MLVRSGWETVRRFDVTDVHRQSLADLVDELDASDALKRAIGEDAVAEAVRQRREQIAVIDEGSMRRESWLVRAR